MSTDPTVLAIDGALRDYATSGDAMRWTAEPPAKPHVDWTAFNAAMADVGRAYSEVVRKLARAVAEIGRGFASFHHPALAHRSPGRTSIARCAICRPFANPKPLTHGAAYRHRQRARRRRK